MRVAPFSEINELFRRKLDDPSVYTTDQYSFLKVFQHALSYSLNDVGSKIIKNYLHLPERLIHLIYKLKALKNKDRQAPKLKSTLIIEGGRHVLNEHGEAISSYFHKIKAALAQEDVSTVLVSPLSLLPGIELSQQDLESVRNLPLSGKSKAMLHEVKTVFKKSKTSQNFSPEELLQIQSQLHIFFESFRLFDNFLSASKIKNCLFENHYHREGMIAALKAHGARSIEIQHGLIARNDLYYVYDDYAKSTASIAFFPDVLLTYGSYWKNVVLAGHEHTIDSVQVVGDYTSFAWPDLKEGKRDKILLITAQKNMADDYVNYILNLASKVQKQHADWQITVKLHPKEPQKDKYTSAFDSHPTVSLIGNETGLHDALSKAQIHLSIYSTTLYDAIGHNLLNLSLQAYSSSADYAADIIKDKVAYPLLFDDDPIALLAKDWDYDLVNRSELYADFDVNKFLGLLKR
ncbi:MAG: hypothetical protein ACI84C_001691 [Flavobacteriales bacterium]|jgi:hypothetical protein